MMDNQLQDVKDGYDTLRELIAFDIIGSDQNQMALAKLLKDGQAQDEAQLTKTFPGVMPGEATFPSE
jgi:hypothetical protein